MTFDTHAHLLHNVHQSRRNGKLPTTRTSLRKNLRCSHRSNKKPGQSAAGVSCVGRHRLGCRDVADMPRRFSGTGWLPSDRQRLTIAYAPQAKAKTGLRRPSTRWAMRRKACCASMERTTQTKDLRFGLTEVAALCLVAIQDQHEQGSRTVTNGQPEAIARHGSGVRVLARQCLLHSAMAVWFPLSEAIQ